MTEDPARYATGGGEPPIEPFRCPHCNAVDFTVTVNITGQSAGLLQQFYDGTSSITGIAEPEFFDIVTPTQVECASCDEFACDIIDEDVDNENVAEYLHDTYGPRE